MRQRNASFQIIVWLDLSRVDHFLDTSRIIIFFLKLVFLSLLIIMIIPYASYKFYMKHIYQVMHKRFMGCAYSSSR